MSEYPKGLRDAIYRTSFYYFALRAFEIINPGSSVDRNWHLKAIAYSLDRVMARKDKRLIINAPPRSLKSFFASVALPAFILGNDPTRKFICASYSQDLSAKLSSDCRRLIESEFYANVFPNVSLTKSTESELQTSAGGFRYATSVGGTLTGRGADHIIVDDPLNAADAYSDVGRKRVNDWYSTSLVSRLDSKKDGTIIIIAQRLHSDDLTGYLREQGDEWEFLELPAIAPEGIIHCAGNASYLWETGEPLQSFREPLKVLDQIKAEVGVTMFNAQYLQQPVPEDGNMLKRDWLREYDFSPVHQQGDMIVQSWDTALKITDSAKYSVCLTFRVRNKNEYYLIDTFREKLAFPDLRHQLKAHATLFKADAILVEDKASGTSLIQYAKSDGIQGVIEITPDADKKTRMHGQTPKLQAKSLILPRFAPWKSEFLVEYLAFPGGRYNDQIDALSQFLIWQSERERSFYKFDFGYDDDDYGAPDPDLILWRLRR